MTRHRYDFCHRTRERIMRVRRLVRAGHGVEHIAAVLGRGPSRPLSPQQVRHLIWLASQPGSGLAGNPGWGPLT